MALTDEQKREYLEDCRFTCPYCKSDNTRQEPIGWNILNIRTRCLACGRVWTVKLGPVELIEELELTEPIVIEDKRRSRRNSARRKATTLGHTLEPFTSSMFETGPQVTAYRYTAKCTKCGAAAIVEMDRPLEHEIYGDAVLYKCEK
jgi:uncharacterized Zn finger protein